MAWVAVLLLAPVWLVLAGIYLYAHQSKWPAWRRFDYAVVVAAAIAMLAAGLLGHTHASPAHGPIWPHVYAALSAFTALLAVFGLAWLWRRR